MLSPELYRENQSLVYEKLLFVNISRSTGEDLILAKPKIAATLQITM